MAATVLLRLGEDGDMPNIMMCDKATLSYGKDSC